MKRFLLLFSLVISFGILFSQTEISSFNVTGAGYSTTALTDYQCLGVNPANLGWSRNDHSMNIGFFEFAASLYSEQLTKKEIYNDLFDNSLNFNFSQKENAAQKFTNTRLWASAAVQWFGFSYQSEKIGGIAFNIRDRGQWNIVLNDQAAQFLYMGYNADYFDIYEVNGGDTTGWSSNPQYASTVYKGSDFSYQWIREFNLGYGRKVLDMDAFRLYAGIGLKYLVPYASAQYYMNEQGVLEAFSALAPLFEIDYGEPTPSQIDGTGMKKVGSGFGLDLGITFEYDEKLKVSLAVNDIGSINLNGNVYMGNDTKVCKIETNGINNYNIFEQGELISADNCPDDPSQWVGLKEKKISNPTNLRGGVSYTFNEQIEAGFDLYVPLGDKVPGSFEKTVFGIGGRYTPVERVRLNLGIVASGSDFFGTNIPFGVSFFPILNEQSTWEIGISTRDVLTLFSNIDPMVSGAFGFLRFSFGEQQSSTRYLEN